MKVLIVGGTGLTVPYVVNGLLKRGHKVVIRHTGTHEVQFAQPLENEGTLEPHRIL